VLALKTWEGEYASWDVPGGVAHSPNRNALYLINDDGSGLRKLELAVQNAQDPHFPADGQWLYFQSDASGHGQIYRCRPDGTQVQNLTENHKLGIDSFGITSARDGRRLLFVSNDGQIGRVAIMDADGANARIIASDIGYHYMASFSPDGQQVVFSHTTDGYRMKLMDLNGKILVNLTPDHPESFCGRFAPDGQTILFFRRDGDIYRVDADGKNLKQLTTGNRYAELKLTANDQHGSSDPPDIAPNGREIAYCRVVAGLAQVHVMNLDGTHPRQLTHLPHRCGRVSWSPDGKQIVFVPFVRESQSQLFVVIADGGQPRQITDLPGAVIFFDWKPK
jgi:Tol biopolymer transport system component